MKNKKWAKPRLTVLFRESGKQEKVLDNCKQSQFGGSPSGYANACQLAQNGCLYCNIPSFS